MRSLWGWLGEARWLTAQRAVVYGAALGLIPASFLLIGMIRILGAGSVDEPADFLSFYAASTLALQGRAIDAWNPELHHAAQLALMPWTGWLIFLYPPPFLLLCMPLALTSYKAAFGLWVLLTGAAFVWALSRYRAGPWPAIAMLAMLAPASVLVAIMGQNGFLTGTLFAIVGLTLDRRPTVAGAFVAMLAYKPHLGLVVLPALVTGRRWRVIGVACLCGLALILVSGFVLGWDAWQVYPTVLRTGAGLMEGGHATPMHQMQSAYVALKLLGIPDTVAVYAQVACAFMALVVALKIVRLQPGGRGEAAAMAAAAPLMTPFIYTYDNAILILPVVWCLASARHTGFLPWEKLGLVAAVVLPATTFVLRRQFELSLGPIPAVIMLVLVLRRATMLARVRAAAAM